MTQLREFYCFDDLGQLPSAWENPIGVATTDQTHSKCGAPNLTYRPPYLGRPRLLLGQKNYFAAQHAAQWAKALAKAGDHSFPAEGHFGVPLQFGGTSEDVAALAEIARDIVVEVRALFSRWLRMQNLCVLVGAGASLCSGGLLTKDLVRDCTALIERDDENRNRRRKLRALLSALTDDLPAGRAFNFEEFLSILTSALRCMGGGGAALASGFKVRPSKRLPARMRFEASDVEALLQALEKSIAVVCNLSLPSEAELLANDCPEYKRAHLAFISKLVSRDPSLGRTRLATTNYDTLLEQAMDRLGVVYADGFVGNVSRNFRPGAFGVDLYYPGDVAEGKVRRYDRFLHLLKLHGSTNWRRCDPTPSNLQGIYSDGTPLPSFEDVRSGRRKLGEVLLNHAGEHAGLGILPTCGKYGETLTMPFSHMFRLFANSLFEPQTVCITLGYSGWDSHINRLIEDALATPSFTLVIVDPSLKPQEWARNLLCSDRCDRVYWFGGDWARFERFSHELLPDLEQMKVEQAVAKQMAELQRLRRSPDPPAPLTGGTP